MSALSTLIDTAVARVISEHPKLFAAANMERARKVLTREIVKDFTREPKEDQPAEPEETRPAIELLPATDTRAKAYIALRSLAGAVSPMRADGDRISVPREADGAAILALAELPPRDQWVHVRGGNLKAWLDFFDEMLPGVSRRKITEVENGVTVTLMPWIYPPSKTGRTYERPEEMESIDD